MWSTQFDLSGGGDSFYNGYLEDNLEFQVKIYAYIKKKHGFYVSLNNINAANLK
jgi:diphthamide synthase (EF-2-diphthine--ammonia ligase)